MDWMIWIQLIGSIFGLAGVALTIRQNVWGWPAGLIQIFLFIWVFWRAQLYSDFILHVIYAGMQLYGWWHWARPDKYVGHLKVTRGSGANLFAWTLLCIAGSAAWGEVMARFTHALSPFPDTFLTVTSLIGQYLLTRKNLETWYFWLIGDLVAIPLFIHRDLYPIAGLHLILLVLAVAGFLSWRKSWIQANQACPEPAFTPPMPDWDAGYEATGPIPPSSSQPKNPG